MIDYDHNKNAIFLCSISNYLDYIEHLIRVPNIIFVLN